MTYRNDHDAALARIDALESDNARLAREVASLRIQPPPEQSKVIENDPPSNIRAGGRALAAIVLALIAFVALAIRLSSPPESAQIRVTAPVHDASTGDGPQIGEWR